MYSKIGDFFKKYEKENFNDTVLPQPKQQIMTSNPNIWGPPFWFSLHISSLYYPEEASPIVKERMKNRILAIPYEIPCSLCRPHASSYIEKNRENLDQIVKGRDSLFKFYVDFHNDVNRRYGKEIWTYEKAYNYYSGKD
jgi:hypothetical protein